MAQFKEEKKIPVMKKSSLGLSIKHLQKEEEQRGAGVVHTAHMSTQQIEEDFIFNERDLNYYCRSMPTYADRTKGDSHAYAEYAFVIAQRHDF